MSVNYLYSIWCKSTTDFCLCLREFGKVSLLVDACVRKSRSLLPRLRSVWLRLGEPPCAALRCDNKLSSACA
jgi:hypothetical protein